MSHTCFRLVPKSTTLDDLEGSFCTLFQNMCLSKLTTKIWMKDLSQRLSSFDATFSTISEIRPMLLYRLVLVGLLILSTDSEIHDLEWFWNSEWLKWPFCVILRCAFEYYLLLIYFIVFLNVVFLNIDQCMSLAGSGAHDRDPTNIWNPREKCRSFLDTTSSKHSQWNQHYHILLLIASLSFHWLQTHDFDWLSILILR